jgi:hypothetical protein
MEFSPLQSPPSRPIYLGLRWARDRSLRSGDDEEEDEGGWFLRKIMAVLPSIEHYQLPAPGRVDRGTLARSSAGCRVTMTLTLTLIWDGIHALILPVLSVEVGEPYPATCILPCCLVAVTSDPLERNLALSSTPLLQISTRLA